jgi:glyoxylate utilization-related uncharacterized protein
MRAAIKFFATHFIEHGLYLLKGQGTYRLNREWVEVEMDDYM